MGGTMAPVKMVQESSKDRATTAGNKKFVSPRPHTHVPKARGAKNQESFVVM
jgi:hypothetical protein